MLTNIKSYLNVQRYFSKDENPIDASKKTINYIQRWVGIRDVFDDKRRSFSLTSVLSIVIFCGTFIYVGSLSQIVYLVQVLPDKVKTFQAINCISATSVPLSKYIFMWTSRRRLKHVIETCRSGMARLPAGSPASYMFSKTLVRGRYITWLVIGNQFFIHFVYLLIPFVFTLIGTERYLPTTPGEPLGFSPKYETPNYEAVYVLTTIATTFSAVNQTGYIILYVTLIAHELGHFYAISETLNHIQTVISDPHNDINSTRTSRNAFVKESLTFCIKHHQFTIKYHKTLQKLYKNIFAAHFVMMTIVIITTLQTLNSWDMRNTILTGATGIMPLFVYCFGGEMLIEAETELSRSLYACGWDGMDPSHARLLLVMLRMSQRPLNLKATIFVMSREMFGNIAQIVYKVYTVFN